MEAQFIVSSGAERRLQSELEELAGSAVRQGKAVARRSRCGEVPVWAAEALVVVSIGKAASLAGEGVRRLFDSSSRRMRY
jgi:hypothetical protein